MFQNLKYVWSFAHQNIKISYIFLKVEEVSNLREIIQSTLKNHISSK